MEMKEKVTKEIQEELREIELLNVEENGITRGVTFNLGGGATILCC